MWHHRVGNPSYHWDDDRVSELAVGLSIAYRDPEIVAEPHEPGTFARRQPARSLQITSVDQYFGPVFVVPRRQGSRGVVWPDPAISKPVAGRLMLGFIFLQVTP